MQQGVSMNDPVVVKLSDSEIAERAQVMARHIAEVERLEEKKKRDSKATQKLINQELAELARLGRVVSDAFEVRKQGDLRFGDTVVPSSDEAVAALARVAEEAKKPKPSEPHAFVLDENAPPAVVAGVEVRTCKVCGSGELDPVHDPVKGEAADAGPDPNMSHAFVDETDIAGCCGLCGDKADASIHNAGEPHHYMPAQQEGDPCGACGLYGSDHVHDLDRFEIGPDTQLFQPHPYRIADSDACLTCGSTDADAPIHRTPVAVVTPPGEVACAACKAGTCPVHGHGFEPGTPENKCARCGKARQARAHRLEAVEVVADPPAEEVHSGYPRAVEDRREEGAIHDHDDEHGGEAGAA